MSGGMIRSQSNALLIVIIGRQGSGKGEQADRLARARGLDHVSSDAVPDELVKEIVTERLALASRGVVLDGYPRTIAQAKQLRAMVAPGAVDLAIHLDVPRHVAIERLQSRRVCSACHHTGSSSLC